MIFCILFGGGAMFEQGLYSSGGYTRAFTVIQGKIQRTYKVHGFLIQHCHILAASGTGGIEGGAGLVADRKQ